MSQQSIHGLFLLNKPAGITSNSALQIVKRLFQAEKAGHTGSLDPFASGVLPICLGEATKFSDLFLNANKAYQVQAKLGITTSTGDIEGRILNQTQVPVFKLNDIEKVFKKFRGMIQQVPPMHSAIKHEGKPLYASARKGLDIKRKARPVMIFRLELISYEHDLLEFYVQCSKGTYIRTLTEEIGQALGGGAHVLNLKRTAVGHYSIQDSHSLFDLYSTSDRRSLLMPLDQLTFSDHPTLKISESVAHYLFCGQRALYPHPLPKLNSREVFLTLKDGRFLGTAKIVADDWIVSKRLVNPKLLKCSKCI